MVFFKFFLSVLMALVSVAFITLMERKLLGLSGGRVGPNKVSQQGILQPMSDAAKLANKQVGVLSNFSCFVYYASSCLILSISIFLWSCMFSEPSVVSFKYPFLILMAAMSLNSLNSILSGWSSFSKFSLLGSMRTVTQLVSYEASLYLCLFFFLFIFLSFSINCLKYTPFLSLLMPWCMYIWLPSFLAELNRTPYDFSEGESELVSGFNTEFGSNAFTLIFLAEYSSIVFMGLLSSNLFFSYSVGLYGLLFLIMIIWTRCVLPRFRFDKLMLLSWKFFVPFLTCMFLMLMVWC